MARPPASPACWRIPSCPRATWWRCVSCLGRRGAAREIGERFERHFGVPIVDGIGSTEMLHIFLSNPARARALRLHRLAGGGLRDRAARRRRRGRARRRAGRLYIHGPSAAMMYWGNRAKTRETFQGGWTKSGDKYVRNADGSYTTAAAATTCSR